MANALFRGRRDLVLLVIDPDILQAEIRFDVVDDGLYPHVYGPLNLDAVTAAREFPPDARGRFTLPAELRW